MESFLLAIAEGRRLQYNVALLQRRQQRLAKIETWHDRLEGTEPSTETALQLHIWSCMCIYTYSIIQYIHVYIYIYIESYRGHCRARSYSCCVQKLWTWVDAVTGQQDIPTTARANYRSRSRWRLRIHQALSFGWVQLGSVELMGPWVRNSCVTASNPDQEAYRLKRMFHSLKLSHKVSRCLGMERLQHAYYQRWLPQLKLIIPLYRTFPSDVYNVEARYVERMLLLSQSSHLTAHD